jgi:hypothetical protein
VERGAEWCNESPGTREHVARHDGIVSFEAGQIFTV